MIKTKIEWCDSTWSPVTGCLHGCPYCYARGIANRFSGCVDSPDGFSDQTIVYLKTRPQAATKEGKRISAAYPYGFTPTFHEYRLADPVTKGFGKTIFVCSTADLFGAWVPDEWILKVFDACKQAMNHRYLFLTKNPERYYQLAERCLLPREDNFWYGTTVTTPDDRVFYSWLYHTFVSIEPILAPFGNSFCETSIVAETEWVIFGAETGHRKQKVVPEKDWIFDAVVELHKRNKPVFMKDSLKPIWGDNIYTEFPWRD